MNIMHGEHICILNYILIISIDSIHMEQLVLNDYIIIKKSLQAIVHYIRACYSKILLNHISLTRKFTRRASKRRRVLFAVVWSQTAQCGVVRYHNII